MNDLAHELKKLPDAYVECRDPGIRHAWEVVVDFHVITYSLEGKRKIEVLARDAVCGRCDAQRQERFIVTKNGLEKIANIYTYAEDYRIPGVPRGVKPSQVVWAEQYRRAMQRVARAAKGERESAER